MGNLTEKVKDNLVQLKGKPANHVTHMLKRMSGSEDGTMADGLMNLMAALVKDKQDSVSSTKKTYGVGGLAVGTIFTTAIAVGIYVYNKRKKKKDLQIESGKIEQIMNDEIDLANAEETDSDMVRKSNSTNMINIREDNKNG
ncbi:MAG: hypothetical protein RR343_06670 [Oscillospiraceae bacterium]